MAKNVPYPRAMRLENASSTTTTRLACCSTIHLSNKYDLIVIELRVMKPAARVACVSFNH